MNRKEFLEAWQHWDEQPGAEPTAKKLENAVGAVSKRLGIGTNDMRIKMSEHRRVGMSREEAIEAIVQSLKEKNG